MKRIIGTAIALTTAMLGLAAPATGSSATTEQAISAVPRAASVRLRVEGLSGTTFEATVVTRGHNVTTVSGGTHHCDGTNNGHNPTPGPTATSALDDGAARAGFTFDGTYSTHSFDDFFITQIGGDANSSPRFWGVLLNGFFTPVGGCQQQVRTGDEVLWAFDAFTKAHFLKLTGPERVRAGQAATYRVTDLQTGAPIAGADVHGVLSDASGNATVTFTAPTTVRVKANRADSIRSNAVVTTVRM